MSVPEGKWDTGRWDMSYWDNVSYGGAPQVEMRAYGAYPYRKRWLKGGWRLEEPGEQVGDEDLLLLMRYLIWRRQRHTTT